MEGVFRERFGLCPRRWGGGICELKDVLREIEGRVDE
jgi:hypothetical protein